MYLMLTRDKGGVGNQMLKENAYLQLQWSCELSDMLGSVSCFTGISMKFARSFTFLIFRSL